MSRLGILTHYYNVLTRVQREAFYKEDPDFLVLEFEFDLSIGELENELRRYSIDRVVILFGDTILQKAIEEYCFANGFDVFTMEYVDNKWELLKKNHK